MNDTLMYFLKANIAIALFYLFYRLFFAGDTFWKTRRFYLLFSIALSFVYPYFSLEQWLQKQEPVQQLIISAVMLPEYVVQPAATPTTNYFSLENIIIGIYALVVITLTARMIIQLLSIARFRMMGKVEIIQNVRVINIKKEITPFSFFGNIYINASLHSDAELEQILAHELTHVRQLHSFDVLVSEMLCNVFWFNPATWLLKREIRQNLEFLADNKVLESGFDSKTYQYHLLQLAYQTPELKITNKFNVSPLKKRITMMNQQKTNKARLLKYSLIVPLALALVVSSNAQEIVEKAKKSIKNAAKSLISKENTSSQVQILPVSTSSEVKANDSLKTVKVATPEIIYGIDTIIDIDNQQKNPLIEECYGVKSVIASVSPDGKTTIISGNVEKKPQFPGGEKALMEFISKNIKYPQSARENGIQGTTIIQFIIDKTGKVTRPTVGRSLDSITDAEAIRVIKLMPKWIPGENKGEKVNVLYTLPIRYRLDGSNPIVKESISTSTIIKSDNADGSVSEVYSVVEQMPQYPGGAEALMQFVSNNVKYPDTAKKMGIQGMVVVKFIVDKTGNIGNQEVVRGVEPSLDAEAIRVVKLLPKWIPGKQNGKEADVYYTLPIKFKLDDGNIPNKTVTVKQGEYLDLGSTKGLKPLLVVNGKIVTESDFKAIKYSDVRSITVLKDQASTAKWGEKGKNGVVVVELK